jgi:hypothetical protein
LDATWGGEEKETEKAFSKPELYEARNDEGNLNAMLWVKFLFEA